MKVKSRRQRNNHLVVAALPSTRESRKA